MKTFSQDAPLRIGLIGTGFGARVQVPAFMAVPEMAVVAIWGRDRAKAEAIARSHNIPFVFDDYRALVASAEVDAVSIATPPHLHHPMALAAIAAGKHVLCEKPLSCSVGEALEMARAAEEKGVTAMVDHEHRFSPPRAYLKELIDEGYIGRPFLVQLNFLGTEYNNPQKASAPWAIDVAQGGGMLAARGSHCADALRFWFGEVEAVTGTTATMLPKRLVVGGEVTTASADDTFGMLLRFANGALGSMVVSGALWHGPWAVSPQGPPTSTNSRPGEEIRAFGSEGMLSISPDGAVWGARKDETVPHSIAIPPRLLGSGLPEVDATAPSLALIPPFIRLARRWLEGIVSGNSPSPSFADGLAAQEVLDAMQQSRHTGGWVQIRR